jgi:excisionase family DNA binding protein
LIADSEEVGSLFEHYRKMVSTDDAAATLVLAHSNLGRTPIPEAEILTTSEVAQRLNVATKTVQNLCRDGSLRCFRVGRTFRVKPEWVQDYIKNAGDSRPSKP